MRKVLCFTAGAVLGWGLRAASGWFKADRKAAHPYAIHSRERLVGR